MILHEQLMRTMFMEREARARRHNAVAEVRRMRRAAARQALEGFRFRTMARLMAPGEGHDGGMALGPEGFERCEQARQALLARLRRSAGSPPTCAY